MMRAKEELKIKNLDFKFFILGFIVLFPLFIRLPGLPVPLPIGLIVISMLAPIIFLKSFLLKEKLLFPKNWILLTLSYALVLYIPLLIGIQDTMMPYSSVMAALQMVLPIGSFYIFFHLLNTKEAYISMTLGAFFAVFLFCLFVLLSKNNLFLPGIFEDVHPVLKGPFEFYQFRQYVGTIMASGMLLGLFMMRSKLNDTVLIIFGLIIVLAIPEMFTSAGAIISLMSLMLIIYRVFGLLKLVLMSPIFLVTLFLMGFGSAIQEAISYELLNIADAGNRFGVWSESIEIIKESPLFGNSFQFESAFQDRMLSSHSQPLNTFSRAGIFPFLIWICIIFYAFYRSYSLVKLSSSSNYYGYIGLLFGIIQLAFLSAMVTTSLDQPYSGTIIWLFISLVERGHFFVKQ
jgi:hypothetical protein